MIPPYWLVYSVNVRIMGRQVGSTYEQEIAPQPSGFIAWLPGGLLYEHDGYLYQVNRDGTGRKAITHWSRAHNFGGFSDGSIFYHDEQNTIWITDGYTRRSLNNTVRAVFNIRNHVGHFSNYQMVVAPPYVIFYSWLKTGSFPPIYGLYKVHLHTGETSSLRREPASEKLVAVRDGLAYIVSDNDLLAVSIATQQERRIMQDVWFDGITPDGLLMTRRPFFGKIRNLFYNWHTGFCYTLNLGLTFQDSAVMSNWRLAIAGNQYWLFDVKRFAAQPIVPGFPHKGIHGYWSQDWLAITRHNRLLALLNRDDHTLMIPSDELVYMGWLADWCIVRDVTTHQTYCLHPATGEHVLIHLPRHILLIHGYFPGEK
jgi:hypothetical protein